MTSNLVILGLDPRNYEMDPSIRWDDRSHMPKMKTKKIVRKRFKITATGKVMHRTQGARHLRSKKSKAHQRRQDAPQEITTIRYSRMVKRFLNT